MRSVYKFKFPTFKSNLKSKNNNIRIKRKPTLLFVGIILIGVLVGIAAIQHFSKKESKAAWWNGDYKYRTAYSFTASSAISSARKVKLDVDTSTLISAGKMQSDCDDVRFTDSNGKVLDYFIDTNTADCNNASTDLYIKFDSISSGGNLIYMYYGNSSITRSDLGGRKNDFFDDTGTSTALKAYWKLNETTANTCTDGAEDACDSTFTNDGAWQGNATYTASGQLNGAVTFDGTGDYISLADDTNLNIGASDVTIAGWIKTSDTNNRVVVGFYDFDSPFSGFGVRINSGKLGYFSSTSGSWVESTGTVNSNNWQHFAITISTTTATFYIDGSSSGTASTQRPGSYSGARALGCAEGGQGGACFTGQLDDIRIYKRALSSTEVTSLYNTNRGREINSPLTFTPSSGPTAASEETTPGPIAYWKFDEGQGQTVNDQTKHTNTAILGNNSSSGSDDPTWKDESMCVSGKCLQFDGSNDFVNIPDSNSLDLTNNISIGAWVNPSTLQANSTIVTKSNWAYYTEIHSDGKFQVYLTGTSSGSYIQSTKTIPINKWSYVSWTYDGSNVNLYINGILDKTQAVTGSITTTSAVAGIGGIGGTYYFKGFIDEVKIYPYARSAAEIKTDYSAGAAVLGLGDQKDYLSDGLVGYWKFDETSGSATDSSGNGLTLTQNGSVSYANGKFGNAASFDGSSSLDYSGTISGVKSISFWVKYPSATLSPWSLMSFTSSTPYITINGATVQGVNSWNSSNSNVYWNTIPRAGLTSITSGDVWGLITVTNPTALDVTNLRVGYSAGFAQFADSGTLIDEVRLYNRELSPDDVRNLYNWAPGPIAYWNLDENTGTTANDTSSNSFTGTLTNGPTWTQGKYGQSVNFDGTNDSIAVPGGTSIVLGNDMTVSMWIKTSTALQRPMLSNRGGGPSGNFYFGVNGGAAFFYHDSSSPSAITSSSTVNSNTWRYVSFVRSGTTTSIYIDGKLNTSSTATGYSTQGRVINIGYDAANSEYFPGSLDEIRIYTYARTPGQIGEDMNASHPLGGSPVGSQIVKYNFDEQQGTTANNGVSINSSLTGTLSNSPTWKTKTDCKINGCIDFDGTNDVVTTTNASAIDLNDSLSSGFTFSSWIYADSAGESNVGQVFQKGTTTYCRTDTPSGGRVDFECSLDLATTDATLNISSAFATGTWNHVAVSYTDDSDDEITIWINGANRGSSANGIGAPATESSNLLIGGTTTANFDGKIDQFSIYNSELTKDQIGIDLNNNSSISYSVLGSSEAANLSDGAGTPPVGWWKLDEKTGSSTADFSGTGNTGTLTSSPEWQSSGQCKEGACLSLTGSNYVSITNHSSLVMTNSSLTLSGWINLSTTSPTQLLFGKSYGASFAYGFVSTSSGILFRTRGASATVDCTTTTVPTTNTWTHLAASVTDTGSGQTQRIYINGQLIQTCNQSQRVEDSGQFFGLGFSSSGLQGKIDEVKVYNYARTQSQIMYDYNRGKPVGWWKMDECQGSTINDSSGNSKNGTITIGASGTQTSVGSCTTSGTAWGSGSSGKYNSSLNYDGTDDTVSLGANAMNQYITGTTATTTSLWFKVPTNTCPSSRCRMIDIQVGTATTGILLALSSSTGSLTTIHRSRFVDSRTEVITSTIPSTNTWHMFTAVADYTAKTLKIYYDGKLVSSTSAPNFGVNTYTPSVPTDPDVIGNVGTSGFTGQLDDVRLYDYGMSATQVNNLYNEGSAVRYAQ